MTTVATDFGMDTALRQLGLHTIASRWRVDRKSEDHH